MQLEGTLDQQDGHSASATSPTSSAPALLVRSIQASERLLLGLLGVALVLVVWELSVPSVIRPVQLSSPSRILQAAIETIPTAAFRNDIATSGEEFILGFAIAAVLGIPLGIAAGWYRTLNYALDPWLNAFNATSRIAFIPLFAIWLGIGLTSKVAIVFLSAFFPVILNTMAGVKTADLRFIRAARCFGAGDLRLLISVILPNSVPLIITGLRQGISRGLVGVVASELFGADAGLGFALTKAGDQLRTADLMLGIFVFALLGLISTEILRRVEQHFQKWRPAAHTTR